MKTRLKQSLENTKNIVVAGSLAVAFAGTCLAVAALASPFVLTYKGYKKTSGKVRDLKDRTYSTWLRNKSFRENPIEEGCLRTIEGRTEGNLEVLILDEKPFLTELTQLNYGLYRLFNGLRVNIAGEVIKQGKLYEISLTKKFLSPAQKMGYFVTEDDLKPIEGRYAWRNFFDYTPVQEKSKISLAKQINQLHGEKLRKLYNLEDNSFRIEA